VRKKTFKEYCDCRAKVLWYAYHNRP